MTEKRVRKSPASKPEILKVVPLSAPIDQEPRRGRKPKLVMPPLPSEIYEGMSEIETQHFDYLIASVRAEYPDLTGTDLVFLNMAALDYVNSLRLQVQQLKSGELVTMSRQHPGVQFRAWMDLLSVTRKARQGTRSPEAEERAASRAMLLGLSQG